MCRCANSIALAAAWLLLASAVHAKETREAFDVLYTVVESENFALKWQAPELAVDDTQAALVIDSLEAAWGRFHGGLAHRLPSGAAAHRINVYVSDASGTPDIPTYGGYMSFDADGVGFIVLSHDLVTGADPGLPLVAAHEYYHLIQTATGAYEAAAGGPDSASWFFEASANWAAHFAAPDSGVVFGDIGGFLGGLEHSLFLNSFDLPDSSSLLGHEYGAFLFLVFLEEAHGPALLRDAWETARADDDPIDVLGRLVQRDLAEELASFAARNATWDYSSEVREHLEEWLPLVSDVDLDSPPIVQRIALDEVGESIAVAPGRPLHAWGSHLLALEVAANTALTIRLEADAVGSAGTPSALFAVFAQSTDDGVMYSRATRQSPAAAVLDLIASSETREVFVGVSQGARSFDADETFAYTLRVQRPARPSLSGAKPVGCSANGRAVGDNHLASLLLVALFGLMARRRRVADR